ncbi:hypothetical protein [Halapricum salinum]|uniref:Uncharacterized protein n=1 Tax=Halapricum salinum TaxID=1457250 RepID=A0A4D6HDC7_9EURY|nr:hypothetical protein [Halapricum salinum]QCC51168.1 hypothetical protein DV733_07900 [Halapricum salinum]
MNEGTRVFDGDDADPDEAVVVWRPEGTTIADWEYEADGETYTTAESNPDYDPDEQLVLLSFVDDLDEHWGAWTAHDPDELYEGVQEHDVPHYGFPEGRLVEADTDEGDVDGDDAVEVPAEFETIRERLEENGFTVEVDEEAAELYVEKYGTEYVVAADGTVTGDEGLRNRVTSIVNRYL